MTDESASGGPQGEDGISVWTVAITLGAALVVVAAGAMIVVIIKRKGNFSHREAENAPEDHHR